MSEQGSTWSAAAEMNAYEAVMWRLGADPMLRVPTLFCEELDVAPDWRRFVAANEWAVRMVPRFRQKVVEPVLGLGPPRWTSDPAFDIRYHVRRQRVPGVGGWSELMEELGQFFMTPLDRHRPPWQVTLFEGLPEGRAVYALKMHHAVADGLGVVQLLSRLHSRTREPNPDKPQPASDPLERIGAVDALWRDVRSDVGAVPALARRLVTGVVRAVADPVGTVRSTSRFGASLLRVADPPIGPGSALLADRGKGIRLASIDVAFADLRAAGKAVGGSVNDAFLAAMLGGYRRYHEAMGVPVARTVPTAFPISTRRPGDPAGGNRVAIARIAGPMAEADPAARIAQVRELTGAARAEPALDALALVSPVLARLPGPAVALLAGPMAKHIDLVASNVPGLGPGHYLAGARVDRLFGYGSTGSAALITFISHGPVGTVGVGFDPAAFTEPKLFLDALVEGLIEVLALHPGSGAPRLYA